MDKKEQIQMYRAIARLSINIYNNVKAAYPNDTAEALRILIQDIQTTLQTYEGNSNTISPDK